MLEFVGFYQNEKYTALQKASMIECLTSNININLHKLTNLKYYIEQTLT